MDTLHFLQAVAALALVLGLIGLLGWGLRRYGSAFRTKRSADGPARLAVTESLAVDARHRLVLVKRDDTEHLLLIGIDRAVVIEDDITAKSRDAAR